MTRNKFLRLAFAKPDPKLKPKPAPKPDPKLKLKPDPKPGQRLSFRISAMSFAVTSSRLAALTPSEIIVRQ